MKYLITIISVMCLMGCATNNSVTKTPNPPDNTITVFYPDGIVVLNGGY